METIYFLENMWYTSQSVKRVQKIIPKKKKKRVQKGKLYHTSGVH